MTVARTDVAGGSHSARAVPFPRLLLRKIDFRDQLQIVTGDRMTGETDRASGRAFALHLPVSARRGGP
jgi:hypothetical protein